MSEATVFTGQGVNIYRLKAMKIALELEIKGLQISRVSAYALAKEELGLTGRPKKEEVLRLLCEHIAQQEKLLKPGDICTGSEKKAFNQEIDVAKKNKIVLKNQP
jgi:hypothetical protein